jgi:hypothetical protein
MKVFHQLSDSPQHTVVSVCGIDAEILLVKKVNVGKCLGNKIDVGYNGKSGHQEVWFVGHVPFTREIDAVRPGADVDLVWSQPVVGIIFEN